MINEKNNNKNKICNISTNGLDIRDVTDEITDDIEIENKIYNHISNMNLGKEIYDKIFSDDRLFFCGIFPNTEVFISKINDRFYSLLKQVVYDTILREKYTKDDIKTFILNLTFDTCSEPLFEDVLNIGQIKYKRMILNLADSLRYEEIIKIGEL